MPRLLLSLMIVLALASCDGGSDESGDKKATTTTTAKATTTTLDDHPVGRLILTDSATGFEVQPNEVADTGPVDLEKAAEDDGEADAEDALRAAGFVHGYQRYWQDNANRGIFILVYEFDGEAGAKAYFDRTTAGFDSANFTRFDAPDVPGAIAVENSDAEIPSAAISFTKGKYLAQVVCDGFSDRALIQAIAFQQSLKLP